MPDFTQGGVRGKEHDWTLGPTGARGWVYGQFGHTHEARQILITEVAAGSPAENVLAKDDVILGLAGVKFTSDARVQFAKAIAAAESEQGKGVLRLMRWRSGQTQTVDLKLQVLGSYSTTAPYDCAKSKHVFELGCAALAARMKAPRYAATTSPIPRALNALALLASGNKEWLPLVKHEAEWAANFTDNGYLSWSYGYAMMLAAEYVIATGDSSVMPGLSRLALETARGQSAVGTWGHKFALPGGNLSGYGNMNAPGLSLLIGMVLAREAGVKESDLDQGIAKGAGFLRWYVNKGALPYGDHRPGPDHDDNGKCAAAAVLFDLLADREAAEFFGKMATAAYDERESGHTGNYFNVLWALPGVSRCGPLATGAYLREQAWYYDLMRSWDWQWEYQGSPAGEQGQADNTYKQFGFSGPVLLAYGAPLKSLRLTGKKPSCVPPLNAAQVAEVIAAGRDHVFLEKNSEGYDKRSTEQLFAGLSSWSSAVRKRSAAALAKREGDFVPVLKHMLGTAARDGRYGACEALGKLGPRADDAAPQLRAALKNNDPWMQSLAAEALANLGPKARKESVSDLLAMTVRDNAADPRRMAQRSAGVALFSPYPGARGPSSILTDSLEGVDRALLIPAVRSMLTNDDSVVRGSVGKAYKLLSDSDLVTLLPDILHAVEKPAPSGEMFADGVRLAGLDLFSRLHIREGMALCLVVMEPERWGAHNRYTPCLTYLARYGSHAKAVLPQLREMRAKLAGTSKGRAPEMALFDKTIASIESSTDTPTLVSVAEFNR